MRRVQILYFARVIIKDGTSLIIRGETVIVNKLLPNVITKAFDYPILAIGTRFQITNFENKTVSSKIKFYLFKYAEIL